MHRLGRGHHYSHLSLALEGDKSRSLRLTFGEVWLEWRRVEAGCSLRIGFPIPGLPDDIQTNQGQLGVESAVWFPSLHAIGEVSPSQFYSHFAEGNGYLKGFYPWPFDSSPSPTVSETGMAPLKTKSAQWWFSYIVLPAQTHSSQMVHLLLCLIASLDATLADPPGWSPARYSTTVHRTWMNRAER